MKPSEALRKGMGMVNGKAKGTYYDPKVDCACAIGCILIGKGISKDRVAAFSICDFPLYGIDSTFRKYLKHYPSGIFEDNYELPLETIAQRLEDIGE